ncbi:glycosyltransferase family 9 protein [bacterium]|nr:glycosyltransferase family 9 protein [bacterium]
MEVKNKKILILRFGALGDIVHTTVIAQALKKAYPDCEIFYCVEERYSEIIENCEFIDKIIPYDQKQRKKLLYNIKFALTLRKEKFDIIFNLTNVFRNNMIAVIANPKRIIAHKKDRNLHVVQDFYKTASNIIKGLILPKNLILGIDENILINVKNNLSCYPRPYFIFSPGGSTDKNRQGRIWNKDYWVELGNELVKLYGGTVFVTGTKDEAEFHHYIVSNIKNSVMYSGKLSLNELKCLYKLADLFVSGDTGPLHLASAFGVNTIGIYGSTDVKNVSPYGEKGFSVYPDENQCRFCWKKKCKFLKDNETYTPCMESIKPEKVLELIEEVLK